MVSPADYRDLVNARWRLWHLGTWRPVTLILAPNRAGGHSPTTDTARAAVAVVFVGDDSADGDWQTVRVEHGDIFSREPSRAIPGLGWTKAAQLQKAPVEAPEGFLEIN